MNPFEIAGIVILFIWIISMPYLKKFMIYNFCMLMVMPFLTSYLIYDSIVRDGFSLRSLSWMLLFFVGGLIYQAKKFYDTYLRQV